jgi:heavy metal sensor kinase
LVRSSTTLDSEAPLDQAALAQNQIYHRMLTVEGVPLRVVSHPFINISGQLIGVIQVATAIESFQEANNTLLTIVVIASVITILVSWLLSRSLAKRILKPIEQVTQAAASIVDAKNLSTRIQWQGANDELGQLTQMFNHMMARLEQVFKVQQRFVGDVSHEMRTPLTSILGHLEIMNKYGVDQESLEAVQREAARMSRMVNDLLLLARADNGELQIDLYPLEIDALVLEVYEQALILAKGRTLKIVLERIEEARIRGNADRLKQLMLNLVSNAIKFTREGGKVTLAIYPEGDLAICEVRDTGIGIAEADVKRIFDRFFQADNSRAHRSDMDGAGLGLSIVKWIVEAHGGTISVKSELGIGTTFYVQFPLLPAPVKKPNSAILEQA